ncbi:hypothetical protein BD413DRAFT_607818 [Trametes elegans]|nr:hypothetical protein BD413DRAFT_607818 [Trametes elegans]
MRAVPASTLAFLAVFQASLAAAQTSLYIPGFDPQAITADVEGVDAQGRTTWRIGPGVTSGTYDDAAGIIGSATLVADATEAHLVWQNSLAGMSLSEDCAINNGVGVCTAVASVTGATEIVTAVATETAIAFEVQAGAGTGGAASSGAVTTEGAASQQASGGSAATSSRPTAGTGSASSAGAAATGSDSTSVPALNPTSTQNNGVGKSESSTVLSLGVVGLIATFLL